MRGAGTNPNKTGYAGISIAGNYGDGTSYDQDHATQTHSHGISFNTTYYVGVGGTGGDGFNGGSYRGGPNILNTGMSIDNSTTSVNPNETRPYNFSVNWILKL